MFTTTKPKMASIVSSSSQQPSVSSCKSCAKCQEIYDSLSTHIMADHALASVNDSILNNVLLNILSLLSGNTSDAPSNTVLSRHDESLTRHEENQLAPVTVISKAEKQRPALPIKGHVTSNTFVSSSINPLSQNTNIANISNDINNTPINNTPDMSTRLSFQPDLISSLFTSLPQQQKIQDIQTLNANRHNLIQPKLLQVQDSLDISFMVPPNNDFQAAAGLIAPDGSLTPAGISFLLANQNKGGNTSGKSDLDVADILVNKMPIPSLNKALDPGLLQLSTLYLQQLAMNTQQNTLSNNTANPVDFTSELMNIGKSEETPNQNLSKSSSKNTSTDNNEQAESIHQILAKHKQISGLIEALSTQQKSAKKNQVKSDAPYEQLIGSSTYTINPQVHLESSIPSMSLVQNNRQTIPVSALSIPPVIRHTTPAATIKANPNGKSNHLVTSNTGKKSIPIIWDQVSSNLLNLVKQHAKSTSEDSAGVHFSENKSDSSISVNTIVSTKQNELQALQNLIIEHPKSIVVVADSKGTETTAESEADVKLRLSSVSMVPISQLGSAGETDSKNINTKSKVLYKCNICGITFSVVSTLQAHLKTHVVEKKEQCNYCQMSFVSKEEYYTHVLSHRGEENVFTCQFCQRIFTSKGDYNKHITKHTQRRPYLCSHCHKAFRDPGSLTKHERIHTGEQPYVCEVCKRGFAEKSSLRKHVRVHSGEQPYKCNQCDKSFSISGNLQRHLFIHTGLRPFKCTECTKAFNNPSHLRRHVKNLHKKVEGTVVEAKASNNNLVFPRIMNTVVAEVHHETESMKTD